MKKMMQYFRLSFCCLALVALFGCQPDSWEFTSNVKFSASTGYDNLLTTKTVYSGEDVTISGTTYERIDWVNNDQIRVMAYNVKTGWNEAYADYKVSGTITPSGRYSTAEVNKVGERGLNWNSTNVNSDVFYAIYPSPAVNSNANISVSSNYATIGGTIPDSQSYTTLNMNNAYMYAAKQANRTDSEVTLEFKPAFTAFQITINNDSGAPFTITSFELSSASSVLTGPFTGNITSVATAATQFSTTGTNKKITVTNLPTTAIAAGSSTSVTLFALPCNLTDLSIIMTADNGTTTATKKLELKQGSNFITFAGGKKYRINVGAPSIDTEWTYVVEPISDVILHGHSDASGNFNVKSYKYPGTNTAAKTAVAWKIQYTTDGTTWTDLPAGGFTRAQDTTYKVTSAPTGNGVNASTYAAGETRTANILGTHASSTTTGDPAPIIARAHLQNAQPRPHGVTNPTPATAFDLSKHPAYGNIDTQRAQETANCYTISAPGLYKFPVVYGNALRNGDNRSAYWPANSSELSSINTTYNTDNYVQHYYLPQFYNAYNELIDEPYILEDLNEDENVNVLVLWQDTNPGEEIIPYPASGATPDNIGIITEDGHAYIWFKIEAANIQPGNFVIALRSNDYILWSWHIWVTDKDLTPTDVLRGFNLMPANLGYIDGSEGASEQFTSRGMKFRVLQVEEEGGVTTEHENQEFIVNQIGDAITLEPSIGANPYYQWGRKDPIIPSKPGGGTRQVSPNPAYTGTIPSSGGASVGMGSVSTAYTDYASGIRYPWLPLFNQNTSGWVGGPVYPYFHSNVPYTAAQRSAAACPYNLWNAYEYADHVNTANNKYKTIYDPCPPGFAVPVRQIFVPQNPWPLTWRDATSVPETTPVVRDNRNPMSGTTVDRSSDKGVSYNGVFFPYTGGRIIIGHTGGGADLEPYVNNDLGYYWSDHAINMQPKYYDSSNNPIGHDNFGNVVPFDGNNLSHLWFYQYGLIFSVHKNSTTIGSDVVWERVWTFTRGSGAAIRPMKDPKGLDQ